MNIYFIGMLISMLVYIILGIVISRGVKTANDFYVAGRQAPTFLIVGSLIASYCSTGLFMGDAAEAFDGFLIPLHMVGVMQIVGYIYGGVYFGRYLRRSEVVTIPEFFEKRFCSRKLGILSAVIELVMLVIYMLSVMQGVGSLMHYVTGIDYNLCLFLVLITFTVLTVTSGSQGVLITDTIMFGIFAISSLISVLVIAHKGGGWFNIIEDLAHSQPDLMSWCGNPKHYYNSGYDNLAWGLVYGIVWMSVCMVAPWQSSRYLMAKNEHVAVRSAVFAALGVFVMEFLIEFGGAMMNAFDVNIDSSSYVMCWAAVNILPTALGVLMLTGVLAAGISSATTFMSIIGAAVGNDILKIKDDRKRLNAGRITIVVVSIIIMILAYVNPPQIFWIMYLGASVIASAWLPVCIASIWSKKVTKAGAFAGMLAGFLGCSATKIFTSVSGITLPVYLDSFIVGFVLNVFFMILVSSLTKVSDGEKLMRASLFVIPESEKNPSDIKLTKKIVLATIPIGIIISLTLLIFWAIPYTNAIK